MAEQTEPTPLPSLKVSAVARLIGVAPATLRTWARRYKIGPPEHQAGAHRLYTMEDVGRLLVMRSLMLKGVAPGEAAKCASTANIDTATVSNFLNQALSGESRQISLADYCDLETGTAVVADPRVGTPQAGQTRPPLASAATSEGAKNGVSQNYDRTITEAKNGGADRIRVPAPEPTISITDAAVGFGAEHVSSLVELAASLDSVAVRTLLNQSLTTAGSAKTWELLAKPALEELQSGATAGSGRDCYWDQDVSEAAWRMLRSCLLTVFGGVTARAPVPTWRSALVAGAPTERCSLAMHAVSAACAERGVSCTLLGPRVPPAAILSAVQRVRPRVAVISCWGSATEQDIEALEKVDALCSLILLGTGWTNNTFPNGAALVPTVEQAVDYVRMLVRHI